MKKFKITASITTYCYMEIEAESLENAGDIADNAYDDEFYTLGEEENKFRVLEIKEIK